MCSELRQASKLKGPFFDEPNGHNFYMFGQSELKLLLKVELDKSSWLAKQTTRLAELPYNRWQKSAHKN